MAREKRPVIGREKPSYGPLEEVAGLSRRSFIEMASRVVAVGALARVAAGCMEEGLDKGRLPLEGSHEAFTKDWGDLSYAVSTTQHFRRFGDFLERFEEELLRKLDELFASKYTVDDISDEETKSDIEDDIAKLLETEYRERGQGDAGLVSLELVVSRLRKNDGPDGDISRISRD